MDMVQTPASLESTPNVVQDALRPNMPAPYCSPRPPTLLRMDSNRSLDDESLLRVERALLRSDHSCVYDGVEAFHSEISAANRDDLTAESHARWEVSLAAAWRLRFEVTIESPDLDRAQALLAVVVSSTPSTSYPHTLALFHLARVHQQRFDFLDVRNEMVYALDYSRGAKSAVDHDLRTYHFLRDGVDVTVGASLVNLPLLNGSTQTQLEGIAILEALLARLKEADPLKVLTLHYLSDGYRRLGNYQPGIRASHVSRAMAFAHQALRLATPSQYNSRYWTSLAELENISWKMSGKISHLYKGIAAGEQAIALIPPAQQGRCGGFHLRITADLLGCKYEAEGLLEDLDSLIKYQYAYVDTGPISPFPYANLCEALSTRFQETGNSRDLDSAIRLGTTAIRLCETTNSTTVYPLLFLGIAYTIRFLYEEDREDYITAQEHLEAAISKCHELSPKFESALAHALESLATLLYAHYRIHLETARIDLAITYMNMCVDGPQEESLRPRRLSLLGECLLSKAMSDSGAREMLDEALRRITSAVDLASSNSHIRHLLTWRRGRAFRERFDRLHDEHDYERAAQDLLDAIQHARTMNHPKQSFYMAELASLSQSRLTKSRLVDSEHLNDALQTYAEAASNTQSFIVDRFQAGVRGGELAMEFRLFERALGLFTAAVKLIPRIAWLGMNTSRRHVRLVSTTSELVCNAAAAAIFCGELERAVELLEEGRSVLWKSMLDLQADVTALAEVDPDLAEELVTLGKALEYDDQGLDTAHCNTEERAQHRRRMAERWDSLLASVRSLPDFESFLLPPVFSKLQVAATHGPIVIINASRYGSHALIVRSDSAVRSVHLPELVSHALTQVGLLFNAAVKCTKDEKGCTFLDSILIKIGRYLWHGGVSEVAHVVSSSSSGGPPRRVWLLPTGLFSLLPIHCAGPYNEQQPGLADMFILSHTTTLSSLLAARKGLAHVWDSRRPHQSSLLAVFQPEVPGLPVLSAALEEKKRLAQNIFPGEVSYLFRETATIEAVKRGLHHHNWFHCCTHGTWRTKEPLKTALRLYDGPVRLFDLLPLRLKSADFAFLSACHTARHGPFVPDESLHLAASLQVAGFRGVLATAWAMADCDGPVLTELFYRTLGAGGRPADPRNAAEALQLSVRTLRDAGVPLWRRAAFVHFGV